MPAESITTPAPSSVKDDNPGFNGERDLHLRDLPVTRLTAACIAAVIFLLVAVF